MIHFLYVLVEWSKIEARLLLSLQWHESTERWFTLGRKHAPRRRHTPCHASTRRYTYVHWYARVFVLQVSPHLGALPLPSALTLDTWAHLMLRSLKYDDRRGTTSATENISTRTNSFTACLTSRSRRHCLRFSVGGLILSSRISLTLPVSIGISSSWRASIVPSGGMAAKAS